MKKSELKDYIKEQITDILSEQPNEALRFSKGILEDIIKLMGKDGFADMIVALSDENVQDAIVSAFNREYPKVMDMRTNLDEETADDISQKAKAQADLNQELSKTADLMDKIKMEEDEDAPAYDKEVEKKASKQDKIVTAFKKAFPDGLKGVISKAKEGDKEAMSKLKSNQDIIKAYNKLKSV